MKKVLFTINNFMQYVNVIFSWIYKTRKNFEIYVNLLNTIYSLLNLIIKYFV